MGRNGLTALSFLVLALLVLAGCGPQGADEDGKTRITLRIGTGHPAGPSVYATQLRDYFVPEVQRRVAAETAYELNFVEGYGGSIAKVADTLEAVQLGLLEIGGYCVCFEPSKLFLHNFQYYVPFSPQDSAVSIALARQTYEKNPWLTAQFTEKYGQELLALNGWDNYHLGTVAPWEKVADLKGIKIGGAGPNLPWLAYAGAIPVQSTLPDGYMAMQTGVYSGWLMFPSAYYSYKFHEPAPYYTLIGFGAMGGAIVITANSRAMAKLPPEVAAIIREVARDYERVAAEALNARQKGGLDLLRGAKAHVRTLPETVRAEWAQSLKDFPNDMAKDADSRGMPGSEIIRSYIQIISDSGHDWPIDYVID